MRRGIGPDLYSYLSYRDFLRDWFASRKAADRRYSHRLFARRAGVSSPSLLKEVIEGRRNLTPTTLEGFVAAIELDPDAAAFFAALVDLDQAGTDDERAAAWDRVASSRRFRTARPIEGASMLYLSNWYYPAIRELALCEGFCADPAWIAARLFPRVSRAQARAALDALFELGLLVEHPDGSVRAADLSLATPHEVAGLGARNYHREMLQRSIEAIEKAPPSDRHLLGVTVAIPSGLVPTLKAELDAVQERLLHLCDTAVESADRVFQIELCMVPLSGGVE